MTIRQHRLIQWIAITLIIAVCAGWYYRARVYGAFSVKSPNKLGLVSYWAMDEGSGTTLGDASSIGNTGTLTNGPTFIDGRRGKALHFDGTNDYVDTAINPIGQFEESTFGGWVKPETGGSGFVFARGSDASGSGWSLYLNAPAGGTATIGVVYGTSSVYTRTGTTTLTANTWYYVTGVQTRSDIKIYVNGVLEGTTSYSIAGAALRSSGVNLQLGTINGGSYFKGDIDDFRVYNQALTATEVATLYQAGGAKTDTAQTSNLVGHWSFNEGTGTTVIDGSGNGNAGTFSSNSGNVLSWADGKHGRALGLGGHVGDTVNVGTGTNLSFTDNFTLSAWVYPTAYATGFFPPCNNGILMRGPGASINYGMDIKDATTVTFLKRTGAEGITGYYFTVPSMTNIWTHLTMTVSGGTLTLYVNGAFSGSQAIGTLASVAGDTLQLGSSLGSWDERYTGKIDEIRIYNTALSAAAVNDLYKSEASIVTVNASQNSKITSGLVGQWSFNGSDVSGVTAYDRSGNSNNGTLTNGPVPTQGKVGQAMSFDGIDDRMVVADAASLNFGASQDFTVAAWVKTTQAGASGKWPMMMSKEDGVITRQGYNLALHNEAVDLRWYFEMWVSGVMYNVFGSSDIADGNWHLLVGTRSGSTLTSYQDGVLANTITGSSGSVSKAVPLTFGDLNGASVSRYNGAIDEVRIYNRALSTAEIASLYAMGR